MGVAVAQAEQRLLQPVSKRLQADAVRIGVTIAAPAGQPGACLLPSGLPSQGSIFGSPFQWK